MDVYVSNRAQLHPKLSDIRSESEPEFRRSLCRENGRDKLEKSCFYIQSKNSTLRPRNQINGGPALESFTQPRAGWPATPEYFEQLDDDHKI